MMYLFIFLLGLGGIVAYAMKVYKIGPMPSTDNDPEVPIVVAPEAPTSPSKPVSIPNPTPMTANDNLDVFCLAIRDYEGSPGDLNYRNNNPGNCRCSAVGYLAKYGNVRCVNNFAVFPTYEQGWEYLQALVHQRAVLHPQWTILDFFNVYAPPADKNNPNKYAEFVAKRCNVPVDTTLQTLFKA